MAQHKTITTDPLPPAQDFNSLRREAIKEISRLAGNTWTDHNSHDPGITILEQICFLLTDLGYRLSFPVKDLLTPSESDPKKDIKQFFTAAQSLPMSPLTAKDYLGLLLDIDGVRNAWIEPIKNVMPGLYWDENAAGLTFTPTSKTERIPLKGFYRALIELKAKVSETEIKAKAEKILNQNRNLCEYFDQVIILPQETISIRSIIDLEDGADIDPDKIMGRIYFELDKFISPEVCFKSLDELLSQKMDVSDIYKGPILSHGYLDPAEIEKLVQKNELRVSDLMHKILDIPGIKAIRNFEITNKQNPTSEDWKAWVLKLSSGRTPRLQSIDQIIEQSQSGNSLQFFKHRINVNIDQTVGTENRAVKEYNQLKQELIVNSNALFEDLPIPRGRYRNLNRYISIQKEFPANYQIGDNSPSASAGKARKAGVKQLQAYLMLFDQILGNYNEQLSHAKDLLSIGNNFEKTCFPYNISDMPAADKILSQEYSNDLQDLTETKTKAEQRADRFLDHLLARFGEKFTDHYLLNHDSLSKTIESKKSFLQNYFDLGYNRNRAFNYLEEKVWDTENVSGLKHRISALLGISDISRTSLAQGSVEGFHLVEHILLRPENESSPPAGYVHEITQFSKNNLGATTCASVNNSLAQGDIINIFSSDLYKGVYLVNNPTDQGFDINKTFIKGTESQKGKWTRGRDHKDPYSMHISFIFPGNTGRFANPNFRRLALDIIRDQTPANIECQALWLNSNAMQEFEQDYKTWLEKKAAGAADIQEAADKVFKRLI